ncbi:MAG: phosphonopyruvate decarboxylase [Pseudobacter sp.]|uniref:phosphonopyruvate decarboxylase n=1 Tax=Pseudobacter sp. TaxID=2045420 RepID=UPI003F801E20
MINPENLYRFLKNRDIQFYSGVPDSLMQNWLLTLQRNSTDFNHVIAVNEGAAVAIATGYYMASGKLPVVYLQNSGLGNAVNALTSITDKEIYSIPLLLFIGWRGAPGIHDEPQHKKMGRITEEMLNVLEIPYFILEEDESQALTTVGNAADIALQEQSAVAILVKENVFSKQAIEKSPSEYEMSRERALELLLEGFNEKDALICTTGKASRELFEVNQRKSTPFEKIFYSIGGMGLANQIALGIDLQNRSRIIMLDGDGAVLMHMGTLATIGQLASGNYIHIVLNNGCHESVGGQPTVGFDIDLCHVASACGYKDVTLVTNEHQLQEWISGSLNRPGKKFLEIRINAACREKLLRVSGPFTERKELLMSMLSIKP